LSDAENTLIIEHRKLVFVKVELRVLETSENIHWSRCY